MATSVCKRTKPSCLSYTNYPFSAPEIFATHGFSPAPGTERTVVATPLAKLLQQAGYRTIHAGKAHLGAIGTPGADPKNFGFDVNIAGHAAGGPGSYLGTQNFSAAWRKGARVWDIPGLEQYHGKDIFLTEAITIEANKAVDAAVAEGKPFFLYMAHYAVHVPFAADHRFIKKYQTAGLNPTEAMYAALVEGMDKSLGDIRANIAKHALEKNTVVLFMSDNGGLSANGRGGKPHTHNQPLSSGKGSAHEGGVRVPMLAYWPGETKPSICTQPIIIEDFFPTLLEIAGAKLPKENTDGRSFTSLLKGQEDDRSERPLYWHFPNNWGPSGPGIGPSSAIRLGDWKLIYYYSNQKYELFNVTEDLGETKNLAEEQPEVRSRLASLLGSYLLEVEAQVPVGKTTGKPIPLPGV